MKANFKLFIVSIVSITLILVLLAPNTSAAEVPNAHLAQVDFCSQIGNINTRIQNRLNGLQNQSDFRKSHRSDDLTELENQATNKLSDRRKQWDKLRIEHFTKLNSKAKTDDAKQAVEIYRRTIETAVNKRRNLVDDAIGNFRNSLNGLVGTNQSSLESLIKTYHDSVNAAINKAQTTCQNGEDPQTVRNNLQLDLKTARENLENSVHGIDKIKLEISELRGARKIAIQMAIDDFKQSAESARQALIKTLGQ